MPVPSNNQGKPDQPVSSDIVRMTGITKTFPGILANDRVNLNVQTGAFHAVIGENGAGKSTLLNVLYGRYSADSGRVLVHDVDVTHTLRSPIDAIHIGIGLVSQHYALIPALSVIENIMLGSEPVKGSLGLLNRRNAIERVTELAQQLGITGIDFNDPAGQLTVAEQQKVEIIKALFRNAQILLLDEPTATLAPKEADMLFALLKDLQARGATVLFITHKLREVMQYSTHVTVLRTGRNAGDFITSETNADVLLERMIGRREGAATSKPSSSPALVDVTRPVLSIDDVTIHNARGAQAVSGASLEVFPGEIVGIAGVDGSGQRELSQAIVGLRSVSAGSLAISPSDGASKPISLNSLSVRQRQRLGISYIPEDRHHAAMIMEFSVAENYILGHEDDKDWGGGAIQSLSKITEIANRIVKNYDVRMGARDSSAIAGDLSGGNQQKVVVARALESKPRLLVACQPTRGLDTGAATFVYDRLRVATSHGLAVLLFSLDLDEVLELSDRIAVMYNGQIAGILTRQEANADRVGELMTGGQPVLGGPN